MMLLDSRYVLENTAQPPM